MNVIERAARILPVAVAELKEANDAAVSYRCIRDTGREYEYAYGCVANPQLAEKRAREHAARIDYMRGPTVRQISDCEWSVHYWSCD